MSYTPALAQLIEALRILPGVGPKSAQRMAFQLLERNRDGGRKLAQTLTSAMEQIGHCERCRQFTEQTLCNICLSDQRNHQLVCVVESPSDVQAIENSCSYQGRYFVLMGHLSPLDGIGPDDLQLSALEEQMATNDIQELIIATNPTVEGEATAHFIADMAQAKGVKVSRIAHGVPLGGELEFVDGGTLAHAIAGRRAL